MLNMKLLNEISNAIAPIEEKSDRSKLGSKSEKIVVFDERGIMPYGVFSLLRDDVPILSYGSNLHKLFKKSLRNLYRTLKPVHLRFGRAHVLNPVILTHLKTSGYTPPSLVVLFNHLLEGYKYPLLDGQEELDLEYTFQCISKSHVRGVLETTFDSYLTHLWIHQRSENALFSQCQLEVQGFLGNVLSESDKRVAYDMATVAATRLPDKEERSEILDTLTKFAQTFASGMPNSEDVSKIANAINKMPDMKDADVKGILNSFATACESVTGASESAKTFAGSTLADVVYFLVACYTMYNNSKESNVPSRLLALAATGFALWKIENANIRVALQAVAAIYVVSGVVINQASKNSSGGNNCDLQVQSSDTSGLFNSISSLLSKYGLQKITRQLLDLIRLTKELPQFVSTVKDVLIYFVNESWDALFGEQLIDTSGRYNADYESRLRDLLSRHASGKLKHSFDESKNVNYLIKTTTKLMNEATGYGDKSILSMYLRKLGEIDTLLSDVRFSLNGTRQEPVTVFITGPPGTHKTILSRMIASQLVRYFQGEDVDVDDHMYVKPSGDFWSQYSNQFITMVDDFGQVRDSVGDPREKGELINIYNTAPYPLEMNLNEEKGKVYYTSSFYIATCNDGYDTANSLISQSALTRRMDYIVTLKYNGTSSDDHVKNIRPGDYTYVLKRHGKVISSLDYSSFFHELVRKYKIKGSHYRIMKMTQSFAKIPEGTSAIEEKIDSWLNAKEQTFATFNVPTSFERQAAGEQVIQMDPVVDSMLESSSDEDEEDHFRGISPPIENEIANGFISLCDIAHREMDIESFHIKAYSYSDIPDDVAKAYMERSDVDPSIKLRKDLIPEDTQLYLKAMYGKNTYDCFTARLAYDTEILGYRIPHAILNFFSEKLHNPWHDNNLRFLFHVWFVLPTAYHTIMCGSPEDIKVIMERSSKSMDYPYSDFDSQITRPKIAMLLEGKFWSCLTVAWKELRHKMFNFFYDKTGLHIDPYSIVKVLAAVSILASGATLATLLYKAYTNVSEQGNYKQFVPYKKAGDKKTYKQVVADKLANRQSASTGPMIERIEASSVRMCIIKDGTEFPVLGRGYYLDTNHILFPLHFLQDMLDDTERITVRLIDDSGQKFDVPALSIIERLSMLETPEIELAIYEDWSFKKTRLDLKPYFISQDRLSKMPSHFPVLMCPYTEKRIQGSYATFNSVEFDGSTMLKALTYSIDTGRGDCGSFVYLTDPSLGKQIIAGLHHLGTPKGSASRVAHAFVLTSDVIEDAMLHFKGRDVETQANVTVMRHDPYGYSKIVPSVLASHPDLPFFQKPARISPREGFDPLVGALAKYAKKEISYSEDILDFATVTFKSQLLGNYYRVVYGDRIPLEICFFGDPDQPYMKAIPTSTSCGFPLVKTNPGIKMDAKRGGVSSDAYKAIASEVLKIETDLIQGKRGDFIYTINMKDETLPIEKVDKGKARIFFSGPLYLALLTKMYFGEFVLYMCEDCILKDTAMTVNPASGDWKDIYDKLLGVVPSSEYSAVHDFDYSGFDASNNVVVLNRVRDIILDWYAYYGMEKGNAVRKLLFMEITHSRHLVFEDVLEWDHSLPSGNMLTLLVNSMSNIILMRYAYYKIMPYDLSFEKEVRLIVMGDDNVVSVSHKVKDVFTPASIAVSVAELGFTITAGDKKSQLTGWKNISEVNFLKRSFVRDSIGVVRGPLELSSIWNTIRWTRRGPYMSSTTYSNILFFYREMALHGKVIFEKETEKLRSILRCFPQFSAEPHGFAYGWVYWDKLVRNTDFLFPVEY